MVQVVGIEAYDAAGNKQIGITTYVGTFLGAFSTGGASSGSFTDSRLIGRTLLTFMPNTGGNGTHGGPQVTLNSANGTVSWNYNYSTNGATAPAIPNDTIYYGGY